MRPLTSWLASSPKTSSRGMILIILSGHLVMMSRASLMLWYSPSMPWPRTNECMASTSASASTTTSSGTASCRGSSRFPEDGV